jgi:hypothetical protein
MKERCVSRPAIPQEVVAQLHRLLGDAGVNGGVGTRHLDDPSQPAMHSDVLMLPIVYSLPPNKRWGWLRS